MLTIRPVRIFIRLAVDGTAPQGSSKPGDDNNPLCKCFSCLAADASALQGYHLSPAVDNFTPYEDHHLAVDALALQGIVSSPVVDDYAPCGPFEAPWMTPPPALQGIVSSPAVDDHAPCEPFEAQRMTLRTV
jgi:hypothetical protein